MSARAKKTASAFRMDCAITTTIRATPERIWDLLTDAAGLPGWNSTVTRVAGEIAEGQRLVVEVPSAPGQKFKLKVHDVTPARAMTWSGGMAPMFKGVRTFSLTPNADGTTEFFMNEAFSGIMLPLIKGSLPDFGPVFETYAADLKRAAER